MNNKSIAILVSITLVVIVATFVAVNQQSKLVRDDPSNQYLYVDLKQNINDVAKIDIVSGKDHVNVTLQKEDWLVKEKNDYTADLTKVKDTIFAIANMTKVEAKTKKAENYGKLGLEDPKQDNATSKLVTLSNIKGDKLAEVIIGNTRPGTDSQFVRRTDNQQAWLVNPSVKLDLLAVNWLDKKLMHINKDRIKQLVITQIDGKKLVITKDEADSGDHSVKDFPADKKLKARFEPRTIAAVLENFSMEDVRNKDAFDFNSGQAINVEFTTFDGLKISAAVLEKEGLNYAQFSANIDTSDTTTQAANAQDEANSLNAKLNPWVYVIPKAKFDLMTKKMSDLIKTEEKKAGHP